MGKMQNGQRWPYLLTDRNKIWACTSKSVGEHPKFQKNMTSGLRRWDNQIVSVLSQEKFANSKIATIQLCQVMDQNHLGVERNSYAKFQRNIFIYYVITGKNISWQMVAIFVNRQTPNGCAQLDQQGYIPDKSACGISVTYGRVYKRKKRPKTCFL